MSTAGWYALHVRPQHECIVPTLLAGKGYEALSPIYRSRRKWSDRIKEVETPIFPGYVFCHFDPEARSESPVVTTPGVLKILGFGNRPAPLDARELESVRLAANAGKSPRPFRSLAVGSKIRITRGPLAGVEGVLLEEKNKEILVVSLSMLQRSLSVEIERSSAEFAYL